MARKAVWNMLLLHGGPLRSWHTKQFYLMANLDPRQVWIQTIPIHGFGPKTHTKVNTFANDAVKAVMNHEDMEAHRAAAAQTIARAKLLSQRPYLFLHRPVKP